MLKLSRSLVIGAVAVLVAHSAFAAGARKHRSTILSSSHVKSRHAAVKKPIGPRAIDDQRATQIQAALIKAGYLTGEPSGHWDTASQAAMEKLQADNGWQTKLVPDSRALIKLGLGPGAESAASGQNATATANDSAGSNSGAAAQP